MAIKRKKSDRKLTEQQVREMRALYKRGYTYDSIRRKYGVSLSTARDAIRRINYRWIER